MNRTYLKAILVLLSVAATGVSFATPEADAAGKAAIVERAVREAVSVPRGFFSNLSKEHGTIRGDELCIPPVLAELEDEALDSLDEVLECSVRDARQEVVRVLLGSMFKASKAADVNALDGMKDHPFAGAACNRTLARVHAILASNNHSDAQKEVCRRAEKMLIEAGYDILGG